MVMSTEQKKRIIKRYLEEASSPKPFVIADKDVEGMKFYAELASCLEMLEREHSQVLDFAKVETDRTKWARLSDVINHGVKLNKGAPSQIIALDRESMQSRADTFLPQPDYYNRTTATHSTTQKNVIVPLIKDARVKLAGLLVAVTKGTNFDATNNDNVEQLIKGLNDQIKHADKAKDVKRAAFFTKYLTVAEDLLKVNKLTAMTIPQERGGHSVFCTLAESAGGVTEKISLISLTTVITQLNKLRNREVNSIDNYIANRRDYKLGTEAILKLPKHGKIEEVQRESMALNVSRIIGLDTTQSCIMTHKGKPALFVPFDDIKQMKDYAKGKAFKVGSPKEYQHYSTINPVGSGLQSDQYVEDFGKSMGFFYVCSDADSMGGYNQNKALRHGRSLYIFDQVIMDSDKMKLDSRLSLQPDQFVMKHTRHGQGRNRTIIEDSSISSKFDSMVDLIANQQRIDEYCKRTANMHKSEISRLKSELEKPQTKDAKKELQAQLKQVTALRDDAILISKGIQSRINKIYDLMPRTIGKGITNTHLKQALVLEKLLHNPTLFTDNGRPYKNPWTYRQNTPVKSIESLPNGNFLLKFDSAIPREMVAFLQRNGGGASIKRRSSKEIEISSKDFLNLKETMLHPESQVQIKHKVEYLRKDDLKQISMAYGEGHRGRILKLVEEYCAIMDNDKSSKDQKLYETGRVVSILQSHIYTAKDKGFGMHVLKKMHFDIQQRLQVIIRQESEPPGNLDLAFAAALKLDRVDVFNKVVAEAIRQDMIGSSDFQAFLKDCIALEAQAGNHEQAVLASNFINKRGEDLIEVFKIPLLVLKDIELEPISLIGRRVEELEVEQRELKIVLTTEPRSTVEVPTQDTPDRQVVSGFKM